MKGEHYSLESTPNKEVFFFLSTGRNGTFEKVIWFQQLPRKAFKANPDADLKELVFQAIRVLPDWAPPRLFIESVTWVTEEWEKQKKLIEIHEAVAA